MSKILTHIAKFSGAALPQGYRRVYVKIAGVINSWTTITSSGEIQQVSDALTQNGIGVEAIHNNYPINPLSPYYVEFTATIISPSTQSDFDVQNIVKTAVDSALNSASVTILSSESGNDWSTSISNAVGLSNISSTAQVAGFSIATLVLFGIGFVALMALKSSSPTSYIPRFARR